MKSSISAICFLCVFHWNVSGQETPKALAREIISADAESTFIAKPEGHTHENKIDAIILQAKSRLNSSMMSDNVSEEMVITYAIYLLRHQIAFAAKNDSVGTNYHSLVAKERILAERLLELDEKSAVP